MFFWIEEPWSRALALANFSNRAPPFFPPLKPFQVFLEPFSYSFVFSQATNAAFQLF
jgi:hypothetical protein